MRYIFLAAAISLICACGKDDQDSGSGDGNKPAPTEGKVIVNAMGLNGYSGKVFLAMITPPGQQNNPYGTLCNMMTDQYSVAGAVVQVSAADGNPCGATQGDLILDNGNYDVGFYIFVPGSQTPTRYVIVSFTIYGDTTVNAPTLDDWN